MSHSVTVVLSIIVLFIKSGHSTITTIIGKRINPCEGITIICADPAVRCCVGGCCTNPFPPPILPPNPPPDYTETMEPTKNRPIDPRLSHIDIIETNGFPIHPVVSVCAKIGEQCSSSSLQADRCCNEDTSLKVGTTSCKYTDFDTNNNQIGTCCIKNGIFGCSNDADCCQSDGVCNNGRCEMVQNKKRSVGVSIQSAAKTRIFDQLDITENDDDDYNEGHRSKPHYDLYREWVSISAAMIIFIGIILAAFGISYYSYYRYLKNRTYSKAKQQSVNDRECDIEITDVSDISDNTDNEESEAEKSALSDGTEKEDEENEVIEQFIYSEADF